MDIGISLKDLGPVESGALRDAVLALDEPAWQEEQLRQKKYEEVHYNTESVIAIFCDHDDWPNIDVVKGAGWDVLSPFAPAVDGTPLLASTIPAVGRLFGRWRQS